jgi:hypothetical protein
MICPECDCCLTWSVDGFQEPRPLQPGELRDLRAVVFGD